MNIILVCELSRCLIMERRSERLLNHQPSFRTFDYGDEDDKRKRDAERKRKTREQESDERERKRLDANAARQASSRERESPLQRHSRQQTDSIHHAASRAAARHADDAQSATADDARRYAAQIENTCVFHMCCVCAYEGGNNELNAFTGDIKELLSASPLASKYRALTDSSSSFALCAASELDFPGVLRGVDRICKQCAQYARKKKMPHRALVNGYFCGSVPGPLANLNTIEVSMVALINPTTKVELIKGGMHSTVNSLSYTNDVIDIAKKLPNLEGNAILRDHSARSHYFRPKEVREALLWLKANNPLYRDVTLEFPEEWTASGGEPVDATTMSFDSETVQSVIDSGQMASEVADDGRNSTNSGAIAPVHSYLVNYHLAASSTSILREIVGHSDASIADDPQFELGQNIADHGQPAGTGPASGNTRSFHRSRVVIERRDGEKVEPHKVRNFDAMAFPQLYPYGEGADHHLDAPYICHRLECGGIYRRFGENLTWLFTHYGYDVRKKNGGISALSEKIISEKDSITKADAESLRDFLQNSGNTDVAKLARIRQLLTYVAPFAKSIPGSQIYMQQERNKMRSFVNSPLTCTGAHWRWFFTAAQSDMYNPIIYDNLVAPSVNYSDSRTGRADSLTKDERVRMVRQNPVIPVRLWNLQQDAFFEHIINGSAKPLGGEVIDWTDKGEFQNKGTSHTHSLYCVRDSEYDDSYFNEINEETESKMRDIVDKSVTATLLRTDTIADFSWDWKPSKRFDDDHEPQRRRFDPEMDFGWDGASNRPTSALVGLHVQELQNSAYMHDCQYSCFKYCLTKPKRFWNCRHEYPVKRVVEFKNGTSFCHESNHAQVLVDRDRKGRPRIRVLPSRNNANIAPCPKSPLMALAAGGNTNLQFLSNKYGAVEYTTGYLGKVDLPDTKIVINTIIKLLSIGDQRHHNVLKAILNGMSNGRHICANEAAFYFLDNKIVKYSRPIKSVNPRPIKEVNMNIDLDRNDDDNDNDECGLKETTQHSTRKDYGLFCRKQLQMHGRCDVSFYSFLTSFSSDRSESKQKKHVAVPLFEIDGRTGVVNNAVSFECCNRRFTAHRSSKAAVIHYRPYFKVDEADELSCSCLLLMYIPWPQGCEDHLIDEGDTAIHTWQHVKDEGRIPPFAHHFIARDVHRHGLSVGQPDGAPDYDLRSRETSDGRHDNSVDAFYDGENSHDVIPMYENVACINADGVHFNVDGARMKRAKAHIDQLKENFRLDFEAKYGLSDEEKAQKLHDTNCVIPVAHHQEQEQSLQELESSLVAEQRYVYDHITEHILDTTKGQLVSFVTGEGGTGKSRIISALKLWSNVVFGKQEGELGACVLCAPTGPAAFNIKGETWQSVFGHSVERGNISTTEGVQNGPSLRLKFRGVKMLVFDEVSMIGSKALWEIHLRLQVICNDDIKSGQSFGGYHVLFFGVSSVTVLQTCPFHNTLQDFYQLPPTLDLSLIRNPEELRGKARSICIHQAYLV